MFQILFRNEYIFKHFIENRLKLKQPVENVDPRTEIGTFIDKFSVKFIESWYFPYISQDEEFVNEAKIQLNYIMTNFQFQLFRFFFQIYEGGDWGGGDFKTK